MQEIQPLDGVSVMHDLEWPWMAISH